MLLKLNILYAILSLIALFQLRGQQVIHSYLHSIIPKQNLHYIPQLVPQYDVAAYYILYSTIDAHNDSTVASAMCFVPVTDTCNFFPIISYQHGTTLKRYDVPSRLNGESLVGQIFCSLGNIVVCPDYLGLGDSPGFHPYCHGRSEATAVVDCIRAARAMLSDSLSVFDNGQVFLTGYSQGGHATMAAHKYIEEENLLGEIQVVASAPCSGPYHISGAQAEMIFTMPDYPSPAYLVYIIFAYNYVYQNLFDVTSEVFQSPYDAIIPQYMNGYYSTSQLNNILPDSLHQFLSQDFYQMVLDDMVDKITPFWQDLLDNDNHNWAPVKPVRMFYCTADEQVSYLNAINAFNAMTLNGAVQVQAVDVIPSASHSDCGIPSIVSAYQWFDTFRIPCGSNSGFTDEKFLNMHLFPNPASDELFVEVSTEGEILCFNGLGIQCFSSIKCFSGKAVLDISSLQPGVYFVYFKPNCQEEKAIKKKFVIIR